jgi:tRNA (guanine6-N2)-methyltransferase
VSGCCGVTQTESVRLALQTLPGASAFLLEDLLTRVDHAEMRVMDRFADGIVIAVDAYPDWLSRSRFFSSCSVVLGGVPAQPPEISPLLDELARYCEARPQPAGTGFRVADIGAFRWQLRDAVVERFGWVNDASGWDLNVRALHGQVVADLGELHMTRRLGELLRAPASTTPIAAAVIVRLAEVRDGARVLDPFCGTGTIGLLAVESSPSVRFTGMDIDPSALGKAAANLRGRGFAPQLLRGSAATLPIASGTVDVVVGNLPFGKRIGSHDTNVELYPRALAEISRVLHVTGTAVLMTEEKRLFVESVQRAPGIRINAEHPIEIGGLHPSIYVVGPTRTRRLDARRRAQRAAADIR